MPASDCSPANNISDTAGLRQPATTNAGPPYYVDLHVNAGELVSLMVEGQEQLVAGPTTITMVSQLQNPPVPVPVQAPPGHMIHQVADENGTLKHIILSVMDGEESSVFNLPQGSFRINTHGELVNTNLPNEPATSSSSLSTLTQQTNFANYDGCPVAYDATALVDVCPPYGAQYQPNYQSYNSIVSGNLAHAHQSYHNQSHSHNHNHSHSHTHGHNHNHHSHHNHSLSHHGHNHSNHHHQNKDNTSNSLTTGPSNTFKSQALLSNHQNQSSNSNSTPGNYHNQGYHNHNNHQNHHNHNHHNHHHHHSHHNHNHIHNNHQSKDVVLSQDSSISVKCQSLTQNRPGSNSSIISHAPVIFTPNHDSKVPTSDTASVISSNSTVNQTQEQSSACKPEKTTESDSYVRRSMNQEQVVNHGSYTSSVHGPTISGTRQSENNNNLCKRQQNLGDKQQNISNRYNNATTNVKVISNNVTNNDSSAGQTCLPHPITNSNSSSPARTRTKVSPQNNQAATLSGSSATSTTNTTTTSTNITTPNVGPRSKRNSRAKTSPYSSKINIENGVKEDGKMVEDKSIDDDNCSTELLKVKASEFSRELTLSSIGCAKDTIENVEQNSSQEVVKTEEKVGITSASSKVDEVADAQQNSVVCDKKDDEVAKDKLDESKHEPHDDFPKNLEAHESYSQIKGEVIKSDETENLTNTALLEPNMRDSLIDQPEQSITKHSDEPAHHPKNSHRLNSNQQQFHQSRHKNKHSSNNHINIHNNTSSSNNGNIVRSNHHSSSSSTTSITSNNSSTTVNPQPARCDVTHRASGKMKQASTQLNLHKVVKCSPASKQQVESNKPESMSTLTSSASSTSHRHHRGNTSSHSNNSNHHHLNHHHQQHNNNSNNNHHHNNKTLHSVKFSNMIKHSRARVVNVLGRLVQNSLTSYSETKFVGLLLIIFTLFAMLLAIFIHMYLVAPVTE